jgi:hypothetical protein
MTSSWLILPSATVSSSTITQSVNSDVFTNVYTSVSSSSAPKLSSTTEAYPPYGDKIIVSSGFNVKPWFALSLFIVFL